MPSVMRKSPISGISYVPYDAGIASIWNISVQRGTFDLCGMISPFKEVPVQVEAAQQWRNGVGRAHSSRDGSAISSIPLPADAALMTGGLEWRGACRHLRPRQIRTGIGSTAEPGSRLGLGASTSTRDVGMPFAVVCLFPTSTVSLVNINALGTQSTRPPLIHRAPHTSHSGFHVYCMS